MHELGVVFHIADLVGNVAKENKAEKIKKVIMQIGEVSTVVNDQLIDCWNWNANRTDLLRGCTLEIEPIPAVTYCEDCHKEYPTVKVRQNLSVLRQRAHISCARQRSSHQRDSRRITAGEAQSSWRRAILQQRNTPKLPNPKSFVILQAGCFCLFGRGVFYLS